MVSEAACSPLGALCRGFIAGSATALDLSAEEYATLIADAQYHRLLPHVSSVLRRRAATPPSVLEQLRTFDRANSENNLRIVAASAQCVQVLQAARIAVVVLKGPLLARELYGDLAIRQCDDVDVLVKRSDAQPACDALIAAGYTPLCDVAIGANRLLRHTHEIAFRSRDGILVELHCDIAQPHYSYHLPVEPWFARAQTTLVAGQEVPFPALEDALVFAVLHGAKHLWLRLDLLLDVAVLAQRVPDKDLVMRQISAAGALRAFAVSCALAARFFGGSQPGAFGPEWPGRPTPEIAALICARQAPSYWQSRRLDLFLRERPRDRVHYITAMGRRLLDKLV